MNSSRLYNTKLYKESKWHQNSFVVILDDIIIIPIPLQYMDNFKERMTSLWWSKTEIAREENVAQILIKTFKSNKKNTYETDIIKMGFQNAQ